VAIGKRREVAGLIGGEAERLAYLFCVAARPRVWYSPPRGKALRLPTTSGGSIMMSRGELASLLEIECANLIEQPGGGAYLAPLVDWIETEPRLVSAGCRRALAGFQARERGARDRPPRAGLRWNKIGHGHRAS
jgi:hypothetical protein